jgi:hypothetical protein
VASRETPTHARAYLVTWEQFEDVVAQENGRRTSRIDLDRGHLRAAFGTRLGSGRYENLLCFDRQDDGFPVVTITSPWTMSDAQLGAPSPAYLKVMIAGLRQSHGMSDDAIVAYLAAAPGCSEQLVVSAFAPAKESEG